MLYELVFTIFLYLLPFLNKMEGILRISLLTYLFIYIYVYLYQYVREKCCEVMVTLIANTPWFHSFRKIDRIV